MKLCSPEQVAEATWTLSGRCPSLSGRIEVVFPAVALPSLAGSLAAQQEGNPRPGDTTSLGDRCPRTFLSLASQQCLEAPGALGPAAERRQMGTAFPLSLFWNILLKRSDLIWAENKSLSVLGSQREGC